MKSAPNRSGDSSNKKKRNIIPVDIPEELRLELEEAAKEIGEPISTLMRLAIRAGLPETRRILRELKEGKSYPGPSTQSGPHTLNEPPEDSSGKQRKTGT